MGGGGEGGGGGEVGVSVVGCVYFWMCVCVWVGGVGVWVGVFCGGEVGWVGCGGGGVAVGGWGGWLWVWIVGVGVGVGVGGVVTVQGGEGRLGWWWTTEHELSAFTHTDSHVFSSVWRVRWTEGCAVTLSGSYQQVWDQAVINIHRAGTTALLRTPVLSLHTSLIGCNYSSAKQMSRLCLGDQIRETQQCESFAQLHLYR